MKFSAFLASTLMLCASVFADPIALNGTFRNTSGGVYPDNWGKKFRINGTCEQKENAIAVKTQNDSFLDESTVFDVVPGGMLSLEMKAAGTGDPGFIIRVFDAAGEQIYLEVTASKASPEGKIIREKYTFKFDYKGKEPAKAAVGIFVRKGADLTISDFKCDYDSRKDSTLKPENRTDWAAGTYKALTKLASEKKDIPVMFLGDSITQLWEFAPTNRFPGGLEVWDEYFKPMGALNFGVSGDTVQNVLWRVTEGKQLECHPRLIVLNIGTNNLHQEPVATPKQIAGGVDAILAAVKRLSPESDVLLIGILPRRGDYPVKQTNELLAEVAKKYGAGWMDVSAALLRGKTEVDPEIFRDGLHLSPKGYSIYAETIAPEIRRRAAKQQDLHAVLPAAKSAFGIAVGTNPTAVEKHAAEELRYFFAKATGATPEISASATPGKPFFLLGNTPEVRTLLPEVDFSKLAPDEIILVNKNGNLILSGGTSGTLYAVYEFVEKYLNVKFFSSTEIEIPKCGSFEFPVVNLRYAPPVATRSAMYCDLMYSDPRFGVRLRNNGDFLNGMRDWGCNSGYIVGVHSFDRIIPAKKYLQTNPEFFSYQNGKRVGGQGSGQLCLTNPELKKEFIRNLLAKIRENPNGGNRVSVSQNDNTTPCACPECLKADQKFGGVSGTLLNFVNEVAAEVEKEYPDLLVETFAYQYTTTPPKNVRPRHNVSILLCSIGSNCGMPLDSESNHFFRDELGEWKTYTDKLSVWCYVANFENYLLPFPNLANFAEDVKFMAGNKVNSILAQGDWNGGGVSGDFVAMRAWLFSKLMWDPSQDTEKLIREFTDGYYGKAAPAIREYLELIRKEAAYNQTYLGCFTRGTAKWLRPEKMIQAYKRMRQAEELSKNDSWLIRERVLLASQSIKFAVLERAAVLRKTLPEEKIDFDSLLAETLAVAGRNRCSKYQENKSAQAFFDMLAEGLRAKPRVSAEPDPVTKGRKTFYEIQAADFPVDPWSTIMTRVDDPKASDGNAIRLSSKVYTWAMHFAPNLDVFPMKPGKYRLYLTLRADPSGEGRNGNGFEAGSYNIGTKKINLFNIPLAEIAGPDYKTIDLGVHELDSNCYIYCAPKDNPDVKWVFVDRMTVIPQE